MNILTIFIYSIENTQYKIKLADFKLFKGLTHITLKFSNLPDPFLHLITVVSISSGHSTNLKLADFTLLKGLMHITLKFPNLPYPFLPMTTVVTIS